MTVNQFLPSAVGSPNVNDPSHYQMNFASSPEQIGLSDDAKEYLTKWLLKSAKNPYPSSELKREIMAHFGIKSLRTLDGFLTRTRKKLQLQNKQSSDQKAMRSHAPLLLDIFSLGAATHGTVASEIAQRIAQPSQQTKTYSAPIQSTDLKGEVAAFTKTG